MTDVNPDQSICPLCFNLYPASLASADPPFCGDCGSEAMDVEVILLDRFMAETSVEKLVDLRERWIAAKGFLESYKTAKLQRIDDMLALKRSLDAGQLLKTAYDAFNSRKIDVVLALMCNDVTWPNGMEGGFVHGHAAVRDYWTRQWALMNPKVVPLSLKAESSGVIDLEVHQLVKDLNGAVLADRIVHHVYRLRDGLIASMEVRE